MLKGLCCGFGSLLIALITGEHMPMLQYIVLALMLGYVAYGISIFLYVRAQRILGAAKTSAYYAVAPCIGTFLSFIIHQEKLTDMYLLALTIMLAGTALVVVDTLIRHHVYVHQHTFIHTHDGNMHRHTVTHKHYHSHLINEGPHRHYHSKKELEKAL